ncbi:MAG: hypothetical protein Q9180_003547, partial [Flavoplaca navasiana]
MQIWISLEGYDSSPPGSPSHRSWSLMTATVDRRATFIKSAGEFLDVHGFHGIDLDWEYPSVTNLGGSASDTANYVALVREMRKAWGKKYGISATLPPSTSYLKGIDAKGLEPYVDFFGYLSYDLRPRPGSESVVYPHTDIHDIEEATQALRAKGVDLKKVNFGLSKYGRGYTLADPACHRMGCKASGPSKRGPCTNTGGLMFNVEIGDIMKQKNLKPEMIQSSMAKQIFWGDQWVGFDDAETLALKTNWAAENCFGGSMIWSLDMESGQGSSNVPSPPKAGNRPVPNQPNPSSAAAVPAAPGKSSPGRSKTNSGTPISRSGMPIGQFTTSGVPNVAIPPVAPAPGKSSASMSTASSGNSQSSSEPKSTQPGKTIIAPPIVPGKSSSGQRTSARGNSAIPSTSDATKNSAGPSSQSKAVVAPAPGKSTNSASITKSSSNVSQFSTSRPSGQSSSSTSQGQLPAAALIIPGLATIPSPTLAPESLVTQGIGSIVGLAPLAVSFERELAESSHDITGYSGQNAAKRDASKRRRDTAPTPELVKQTLIKLASSYALLGMIEKEIGLINANSLPGDTRRIVDSVKKALPGIDSGLKDGINSLTNAIKNPKQIKIADIAKANALLGKQGSVTQQVLSTFKQLTDWKPPVGSNDIILPDLLTLPSPSLGDNWKGTIVPGVLTIPSPSLHWSKGIMSASNNPGAAAGSSGGSGGVAAAGAAGAAGGVISGLLGLAKQAEGAVASAGKEITRLSGLPNIDAPQLSNAVSLLTSATKDVGGLGAALDSSLADAYELNQRFPPADVSKVVQAQAANKALSEDLKLVLKDLAGFITRPTQSLATIKRHAPKFVVGGTILALMAKSDSAVIASFPKPVPIIVGPSNSTIKKPVDEFFMISMVGTSVEAFQRFIQTLPDGGVGPQKHYDWPRQYQTYVGRMTLQEALAVNKNSVQDGKRIIDMIGPNKIQTFDYTSLRSRRKAWSDFDKRSNGTTLLPRVDPNWEVLRRPESLLHLRMLSYDPQRPMNVLKDQPATGAGAQYDYLYDSSSGSGATIYVTDSGFDFQHQEFQRGTDLIPRSHIPESFGNVALSAHGEGHGELVAALAVGYVLGVANEANLVAVKTRNSEGIETAASAYDNWKWIVADVKSKSLQGKAVINYSGGWNYLFSYQAFEYHKEEPDYARWGLIEPEHPDFFLALLVDCWEADIVTVFAAGNRNPEYPTTHMMGQASPQRYANPNNPIITVGALNPQGLGAGFNVDIAPDPTAQGRDRQLVGEFTVWALGEDMINIKPGTQYGLERAAGTSMAAPQIAGLAAYLLRLPGLFWPEGRVSKTMKNYLIATSRKGPRSPDAHGAAYNSIENVLQWCQTRPPGLGKSRRWYTDLTAIPRHLAKIFGRQQQIKDAEFSIFKDGHLTDPKYSNEFRCKLPGGFEPKPTWSTKKPSSSTSTSSRPAATSSQSPAPPPKPAPPPAPPKETIYPAPAKESDCYAKDKDKTGAEDFKLVDSETFIEVACKTQEKYPFEVFSIIDDAHRLLKLKVGDGDDKKANKPFSKDACISSFSRAVRQCPTEENNRTYGGHVRISTTPFVVTAGKMEFKTKDIKCYTNDDKSAPDWLKPRYERDEARKAINEVCIGTNNWEVKHTETKPSDHVTPLYTFTVELKNGKTYLGFDKALCKKVFEGIVDK